MSAALAHAPTHAAAPAPPRRAPVQCKLAPRGPAPFASLSSVPAIQRKCAACEADEGLKFKRDGLSVGPENDKFEREADSIAGEVMAMRESDVAAAPAGVQRKCAARDEEDKLRRQGIEAQEEDEAIQARRQSIEAEEDKEVRARRQSIVAEEEEAVQARRQSDESEEEEEAKQPQRDGAAGDERLAASDTELTSGGAPLPSRTRDFFETRTGRDLSGVRLHQGGRASTLNRSVRARAFTYRNHIWLGSKEGSGPSFTLAHELSHVMQQTSPGPVGPPAGMQPRHPAAVGRGPPRIQRAPAEFWLPIDTRGAFSLHTTMHNAAQDAIVEANPGKKLRQEVAMPGAKSGVGAIGPENIGFADLYLSDNGSVPGLRPWNPAKDVCGETDGCRKDGTPLPVTNLSKKNSKFSGGFYIGDNLRALGGARISHYRNRYPKMYRSGKIVGLGKAPTNMQVGEVKPGHDEDYRDFGSKHQLQNYVTGLRNTVGATNAALAAAGSADTWAATAIGAIKDGDITIPTGWDMRGKLASSTTWPITRVKIRSNRRKTVKLPGGKRRKGNKRVDLRPGGRRAGTAAPTISGRWVMAPDLSNPGLMVYYLMPNPDELEAALRVGSGATHLFRAAAVRLQAVLDPLTKPPTVTKPKVKKRPDPAAGSPPACATQARACVQRDAVDTFDRKEWNKLRGVSEGRPKDGKDSLADQLEAVPEAEQEQIENAGAMVDWLSAPKLPGQSRQPERYPAPGKYAAIQKDARTFDKVRFWSGTKATPFGFLREKFGGVFVRVANKFQEIREKFRKKFEDRDITGGKKGTIRKAAREVGKLVLNAIGKPLARAVLGKVMECARIGFAAKVQSLLDAVGFEALEERAAEVQQMVDSFKEDALGKIEEIARNALEPIESEIQLLIQKGKTLAAVLDTIKTIAQGVRVGTCVASLVTAPETVGIGAIVGCGAALGDWILSQFGMSPVEYFIAATLRSCESKMLIARAIEGTAIVKSLPTFAAKKIVAGAKSFLKDLPAPFGEHAAGLLCNENEMTVTAPQADKSEICPVVIPPKNFGGKDPTVPEHVYLYQKGDSRNDAAKEKEWQGWDDEIPPDLLSRSGRGGGPVGINQEELKGPIDNPTNAKGLFEITAGLTAPGYDKVRVPVTVTLTLSEDKFTFRPFTMDLMIIKYPVEKNGRTYATAKPAKPWHGIRENGFQDGKPYTRAWGPSDPEFQYDFPVNQ